MPRFVQHAAAMLIVAPLFAGCSYFDGGRPEREASVATVGRLTTACARLQPFFGPSDQELTRDLLEQGLKAELAKWDKDNSGDLTNSELDPLNDALREENVGASPVRDWNGDGRADFQEFASGWRTMFDLCDSNRSKTVSLRELGHSPNVTPARTVDAPKKPPEGASAPPKPTY